MTPLESALLRGVLTDVQEAESFNAPMGEVIEHFKDSGSSVKGSGVRAVNLDGSQSVKDLSLAEHKVLTPKPLSDFQRGYEAGLQTGYNTGYSVGELAGRAQGIRLAIKSLSDCFAKPAASALDEKIEEVKGSL
jgi:hypothetical protein